MLFWKIVPAGALPNRNENWTKNLAHNEKANAFSPNQKSVPHFILPLPILMALQVLPRKSETKLREANCWFKTSQHLISGCHNADFMKKIQIHQHLHPSIFHKTSRKYQIFQVQSLVITWRASSWKGISEQSTSRLCGHGKRCSAPLTEFDNALKTILQQFMPSQYYTHPQNT